MAPPSEADENDPLVPIVCSECDTASRVPLAELAETIERHNDHRHDGDDVAQVDPDVADHIADLIARELGFLDG
ncbi:hypothetical protein [Halosolutus gelatinilyticus]|uniref:hypothetical protein n=1 Tax=Halosolutus gelatinilyticus TaxID=2931975 RepID=UPI001FF6E740|nr:hypothetical protein [Halosolutus gelatinilyticus]